jgi:hypothetical protein
MSLLNNLLSPRKRTFLLAPASVGSGARLVSAIQLLLSSIQARSDFQP